MKFLFSLSFLTIVCLLFGPGELVQEKERLASISGGQTEFPKVDLEAQPLCDITAQGTASQNCTGKGCNHTMTEYTTAGTTHYVTKTYGCGNWADEKGWTEGVDANGDGDFDDPGDTPPAPINPCGGTDVDHNISSVGC